MALWLYLGKVVAVTLAQPWHLRIVSTCESKNHWDWDGSLRPHAQSISGWILSSMKDGCSELALLQFEFPHLVLHLPSLKWNFYLCLCGLYYIHQNKGFCSTIVNWSLRHHEQGCDTSSRFGLIMYHCLKLFSVLRDGSCACVCKEVKLTAVMFCVHLCAYGTKRLFVCPWDWEKSVSFTANFLDWCFLFYFMFEHSKELFLLKTVVV